MQLCYFIQSSFKSNPFQVDIQFKPTPSWVGCNHSKNQISGYCNSEIIGMIIPQDQNLIVDPTAKKMHTRRTSVALLPSIQCAQMCIHAVFILHHPTCTHSPLLTHGKQTHTKQDFFHSSSHLQIHSLRQTHTSWKREESCFDRCLPVNICSIPRKPTN